MGGAAAFVAPFGRKPYGAPSCRARRPQRPTACGAHRILPGATSGREDQAVSLAPDALLAEKGIIAGAGMPRIVRVGPSSVNGA